MHLFVYGTLLSSIPSSMSKFLGRRAKLVGQAEVKGTLYDLGMYPGFSPGGGATVRGELYELAADQSEETLSMLDAYESVTGSAEDEYARQSIVCETSDGTSIKAQTYVSRNLPTDAATIPGGKYAQFYKRNAKHKKFVNGG